MEENRTKVCCSRDCYYLTDDGRCQYGKNISLDEREKCGRCEGYRTTIAERWGICSKGFFIDCCDYFCNDFEEDEEDEDDNEDYED